MVLVDLDEWNALSFPKLAHCMFKKGKKNLLSEFLNGMFWRNRSPAYIQYII